MKTNQLLNSWLLENVHDLGSDLWQSFAFESLQEVVPTQAVRDTFVGMIDDNSVGFSPRDLGSDNTFHFGVDLHDSKSAVSSPIDILHQSDASHSEGIHVSSRGAETFSQPAPEPMTPTIGENEFIVQSTPPASIVKGDTDDSLGTGDPFPPADLAASAGTSANAAAKPAGTIAQLADYLVNGFWQYNSTIAHHWGSSTISYNIDLLNPAEQALAISALNAWHEVANLTFVRTSGSASITYNHNGSQTAYETDNYTSSGVITSATIDISADWITTDGGAYDGKSGIDSYGYQTYIHETGHALGLGHQGPYNGSATYSANALYADDTWQYSVMSYFSEQNYNGGSYRYVITPQMADIYAVQLVYGSASVRTGDTVYGFNNTAGSIFNFSAYSQAPAYTIFDSSGNDTLDCSGYSQAQVIDLHPGAFSSVGGLVHNVGLSTTTIIERAIGGSGNDTLVANDVGCMLTGGGGNDTLIGGGGVDAAEFSGLHSQYSLAHASGNAVQVFDLRVGSPDGVDLLSSIEFLDFSDGAFTIGSLLGTPPIITVHDLSGTVGTSRSASSLFSVVDPDGRAIVEYQFWDGSPGAGNFIVNGMAQSANQIIDVSAAQLAQTSYLIGSGTETLYVRAFDGRNWSVENGAWDHFSFTGAASVPGANHPPIITLSDKSAVIGSTVAVASLFSVTDADSDTITAYQFWDGSSGGGHFTINGVLQGDNRIIDVTAAQLANTNYVVGSGTETLYMRAFDGHNWSVESGAWDHFNFTGTAGPSTNHPPIVSVNDASAAIGSFVTAASLFSVTDADSDAITAYQFWDGSSGGGHFTINGAVQGSNRIIDVTAGQLANTNYVAGSGTETLYVRAFDGHNWSVESGVWDHFSFTGNALAPSANHPPIVTVSDASAAVGSSVAATSLFSVSDTDGNSIIEYQFWDGSPGAGHFVVNGVGQSANQTIDISAAQLAQTSYVVGSGTETLYVRAFDGRSWSTEQGVWSHFQFSGVSAAPLISSDSQHPIIAATDQPGHFDLLV